MVTINTTIKGYINHRLSLNTILKLLTSNNYNNEGNNKMTEKNQDEITVSKLMLEMNNFELWMPDGVHRDPKTLERFPLRPEAARLVQSIDEYIKQMGFDINKYERLGNLVHLNSKKMISRMQSGDDNGFHHYGKRSSKLEAVRLRMQVPIYQKMLEEGYSRRLLIS